MRRIIRPEVAIPFLALAFGLAAPARAQTPAAASAAETAKPAPQPAKAADSRAEAAHAGGQAAKADASHAEAARGGLAAKADDIDIFMARVLERRDQAWKKLHDYVLSETERFDLTGPAGVRLHGMRREYSWYVRDGYLVRSPVRFDGVAIGDGDRRQYEDKWLTEEKRRETKRASKVAEQAESTDAASAQGLVDQRGEPRFISEAFFLKFKFEAGNYYLVGRERMDGRDVVRVEYYPTRLFDHGAAGREDARKKKARKGDTDMDRRIERDMNKVSVVTLWIDPSEYQVVRYEFENVDFGFLPARWLLRVDSLRASMTMAPAIDGVWLPRDLDVRADLMLASGTYGFRYGRQLYDYKKAETGARIRSIGDPKQ